MGKSKKDSADIETSIDNGPRPQDLDELRRRLTLSENGKPKKIKVRIISNSMSPILPVGAFAEMEACRLDDLKFLDVIVFNYNAMLTCHCFISHGEFRNPKGERTFVTKGLANRSFDFPIAESELVGKIATHKLTPWRFALYSFLNRWLGATLTHKFFAPKI
jgi:signal peptidase I